jgi:undecaprenyl-diphosphatase
VQNDVADDPSLPPGPAPRLTRLARLLALDDRLLRRLVRHRRVRSTFFFRIVCRLFDPDMVVMAILIAVFQPVLHNPAQRFGWALGLSTFVAFIVKYLVRRARPSVDVQAQVPPDRFSFPSGHTAGAFALAMSTSAVSPWLLTPMLVVASTVGYARMYLGVHYPLDVAAGAVVGMLTGSIVALW